MRCPSKTECVTVDTTDNDGTFITFQPLTGHKTASANTTGEASAAGRASAA